MPKKKKEPLSQNFTALSLIRFAFPSMATMLFMGLYTVTDIFFAARFIDTNALSSINIVCPVLNLIVGLGTMLAAGGSAVTAQKMGSGKMQEAQSNFTQIVLAGAAAGAAITVAGLLFPGEIARALGASELLMPDCREYLRIQLLFAVGSILQVLYQNFFVTAGKPALGLILSLAAGAANLAFDYVFMGLLRMGIRGAALGTGIGYMIPTVCGTIFFFTNKSGLCFRKPMLDNRVLWKSCSNGASEMVSQLAAAVTTFLFNAAMMKRLGEDGVAAVTVMIYSQFLLTSLYIGFSMGTAPVISYNYGAKNCKQLQKTVYVSGIFIGIISLSVFLFSFLAGEKIAALFAGGNRNMLEITSKGFPIFSFSFLFSGYNIFASALFTALSNGKTSAAISFSRTFGFLTVFLWILPEILGVTGVWLAVPAAELLTFALTGIFLFLHAKRRCGTEKELTFPKFSV